MVPWVDCQTRCYGAGVDEDIASVDVDVNRWSTPHAEVERPEPIPHASQPGSHADRRDRDEPFELARCGDCAWHRAPAAEFFYEKEFRQSETISGLVGLIWRVRDNLSFDVGLRHAVTNGHPVNEVRAGLTFGFPLPFGGDPSRSR